MSRGAIVAALSAILLAAGGGCTLTLKDTMAPSAQLDLEAQYELKRWGDDTVGWVPSPAEVKRKEISRSGVGLHVRGRLSNTFTWMDPDGTLESDYFLYGQHKQYSEPVEADGWGYRGRLSIMPGFSFAGDSVFLSPFFFGVEGAYTGLEIRSKADPADGSWADLGRVGIPIGFHVEGTIAHAVTPYFTFAYVPTIYNGGAVLAGHDFTYEVGARLWPGSLAPVLGDGLWVEAGWLWTTSSGISDPFGLVETRFEISGPFLGVGWRF